MFWWDTDDFVTGGKDWWNYIRPPNMAEPNSPWRCVQLDPGGNGYTSATASHSLPRTANPNVAARARDRQAKCQAYYLRLQQRQLFWGRASTLPEDPRVMKIFIVPWDAYKNVRPARKVVPVRRLAGFYITAWSFNNGDDPCPGNENNRLGGEQVGGYFIKPVESSGPSNPQARCNPNDVNLCTSH